MPDDCIYFAPVRNTMTQIPGIRQERYRPSISDSQMRTDTIFVPVLSRGIMPGSADGGQKNRRRGRQPGAGGRGPPDRRQVKKRQRAGQRPDRRPHPHRPPRLPPDHHRLALPIRPARTLSRRQKETSRQGSPRGRSQEKTPCQDRPRTGRSPGRIPDPRPHCGRQDANPYRA